MKSLPKISIVIPSYNKGKYIQKTLESIVSQKYSNLEVIIQDGGSTDETISIIEKYARKYPKIINWVSKRDKGQVDAINQGLKKASGDIFAYINADDIYEKGALLKVGRYFKKYPKTTWVAGRGKIINVNGLEISRIVTIYKNILLAINQFFLLKIVNYLMQPSVFLSMKTYKKYGSYTGTNNYVLEYGLWLKIACKQMPGIINRPLSSFRISGDNISSTQFKSLLAADLNLVKKYTNNFFIISLHRLHNIGRIITIKTVINSKDDK